MRRYQSVHELGESELLNDVVRRIEGDEELRARADALLSGARAEEPLIDQLLMMPQDIRYHAEGPIVEDHIRLMLMGLYAVVEEKVHLIDIEEFRRLKGYEGEIDEMEELLKENVALFEVYALCHDIGKRSAVSFVGRRHSRGEQLGFVQGAQVRDEYLLLFSDFAVKHPELEGPSLQRAFYLEYEIDVKYPGHARAIHAPLYVDLLDRFAAAHELTSHDRDLLDDLIAQHIAFGDAFSDRSVAGVRRFHHYAMKRGYDGDDFLDLLQCGLFLDQVIGSRRADGSHESERLVNALVSEHDFAPHKRMEKHALREAEEERARKLAFAQVGLDGKGLLSLLRMNPGPEFGAVLVSIQDAVIGRGDMPSFDAAIDEEVQSRAAEYYNLVFEKGE